MNNYTYPPIRKIVVSTNSRDQIFVVGNSASTDPRSPVYGFVICDIIHDIYAKEQYGKNIYEIHISNENEIDVWKKFDNPIIQVEYDVRKTEISRK